MGPTDVALSSGDADAARFIYCHGFTGGAKYIGIADRNQSAAVEHKGSYAQSLFVPDESVTILSLTANSKRVEKFILRYSCLLF